MELSRVLDQSQPRVSRHLKLMTDAGLIERFPDGARVYYRLSHDAQARRLIDTVLDILADDAGEADHRRLDEVRRDREEHAARYFEQVAPQWDKLRSLYVSESAVEAALVGKPWSLATVEAAVAAFAEDFTPMTDMRASAAYRLEAAGNMLIRYALELSGQTPRILDLDSLEVRA